MVGAGMWWFALLRSDVVLDHECDILKDCTTLLHDEIPIFDRWRLLQWGRNLLFELGWSNASFVPWGDNEFIWYTQFFEHPWYTNGTGCAQEVNGD